MSHAGVVPDRDILPMLPDGTLMIGGHDHLTLVHEAGKTVSAYRSWGSLLTIASVAAPATRRRSSVWPSTATARLPKI